MTDKPIPFRPEMVRAILREIEKPGAGKTQTRRAISPHTLRIWTGGLDYLGGYVKPDEDLFRAALNNPRDWRAIEGLLHWVTDPAPHQVGAVMSQWMGRLPYAVGDRLWVREHWWTEARWDAVAPRDLPKTTPIYPQTEPEPGCAGRFRQAMHMPRWASRLTLLVTDVRVERLQEISEDDCRAEGLAEASKDGKLWKWGIPDADDLPGNDNAGWHWRDWCVDPRAAYARLWDQINGRGSWDRNPWVCAIGFKPLLCNIDKLKVGDDE